MSPKPLTTKLRAALAFDETPLNELSEADGYFELGERAERARTSAIEAALIEVAQAADAKCRHLGFDMGYVELNRALITALLRLNAVLDGEGE